MIAYLCLGSNMDDPPSQLATAVEYLKMIPGMQILRQSQILRSSPYGYAEQADFFNIALEIEYLLDANTLLKTLKSAENALGREQSWHWGPRRIDLDILFYGHEIVDTEDLTIPHPDLHNRRFVLDLLVELIPDFIHPRLGQSMKELQHILMCKPHANETLTMPIQ